jgi:hypothetical protein
MSGICSMQCKWRKFAEKVVRRPPNLNVRTVCHGNVALKIVSQSKQKKIRSITHDPSGENCMSFTGLWKLK